MHLSAADWSAVFALLDEALDLDPAQRKAWLAALAPERRHLQAALRRLLEQRSALESGAFLDHLPTLSAPGAASNPVFGMGHRIGPYALLRELGSGGMASVWLAERADGAHGREVALKLPYLGARARVIGERFTRERQILSALTHPHIASVLDAGLDGSQPWLAMEYVDGQALTVWADEHRLDVPARLRLFLQVLQAVQHAHAQLVIHRDLKPGNVLVDSHGLVKLLDFGVAKLLDGDGVTQDTEITRFGGRALTPQYASPEQVAGRALGTASDVYSLGVLLYELLSGHLPYVLKRATTGALEEAILAARIDKPSAAAADRTVQRALRGDLDTIVLKALAARPADRYASAEAFAQDIERHLQSLPILARPASLGYRLGRLLKRHGLVVVAASVTAVALLVGAGVSLWQADRARAESQRSQAVQAFLAKVLSYNDPQQAQGRQRSARELLDLAAGTIDAGFAGKPDVQARLHQVVGAIYIEMGAMAPAAGHLRSALAWHERAGSAAGADAVEARFRLGQAQVELRDFAAASASLDRTLTMGDALGTTPHRWSGRVLAYQAYIASQQGQLDRSAALGDEALRVQRLVSGERSADYLTVASNVAANLLARGQLDAAQHLLGLIELHGPALPDYPITDQIGNRAALANLRFNRGEFAAAERTLREIVPLFDRHLGPMHDRSAVTRSLYARALAELGRYDEAVQEQQANVGHVTARNPAEPEAVNLARLQLVRLLTQAGRHDESLALAREVVSFFDARHAQPTRYREAARWYLADALLGRGLRDEGVRALQASLANAEQLGKANNPLERAGKRLSLAVALRATADAAQGAELAAQACEAYAAALGPTNPRVGRCRAVQAWLAALVAPDAQRAEAAAGFSSARDVAWASLPTAHPLRAELRAAEAEIVRLAGDATRAGELQAQAREQYRQAIGQPLPEGFLVLH